MSTCNNPDCRCVGGKHTNPPEGGELSGIPYYELSDVRTLRNWMQGEGELLTERDIWDAWGDFSGDFRASWLGDGDMSRGNFAAWLIGERKRLTRDLHEARRQFCDASEHLRGEMS